MSHSAYTTEEYLSIFSDFISTYPDIIQSEFYKYEYCIKFDNCNSISDNFLELLNDNNIDYYCDDVEYNTFFFNSFDLDSSYINKKMLALAKHHCNPVKYYIDPSKNTYSFIDVLDEYLKIRESDDSLYIYNDEHCSQPKEYKVFNSVEEADDCQYNTALEIAESCYNCDYPAIVKTKAEEFFAEYVCKTDTRGQTISSYDGIEFEVPVNNTMYYIYRVN